MNTSLAESFQTDEQWIEQKLVALIKAFPTTRVSSDLASLNSTYYKLFGNNDLLRFKSFFENQNQKFLQIRNKVVSQLPIASNGKTAVISGRSIVGLANALLLAKLGYDVEIYDKRELKTRNIQWALRQSLLNQLAALDPELAELIMNHVAKPLKESVHLGADGLKAIYKPEDVKVANPTLANITGDEMLRLPSVMTVEAKVFEQVFENFLKKYSSQIKLVNKSLEVTESNHLGQYSIEGRNGTPDEIIIAEGANSTNRQKVGIESVKTTVARLQIAGEVHVEGEGRMAKFYRVENGDSMISYTMETEGSSKIWLVADVHAASIEPSPDFKLTPAKYFEVGTVEYKKELQRLRTRYEQEKSRLIDIEFRRLAAPLLSIDPEKMKSIKISGVFEGSNLPSPFWLDQKISTKAIAGNNLRLAGDAVGNATPTVGGGMQVGAVSHLERAKRMHLAFDLLEFDFKNSKFSVQELAYRKERVRLSYSNGVISDTLSWHIQGVPDMYLYLRDGGVKINKIPESSSYSSEFNPLVNKLNKELENITDSKIIEMSDYKKDNYYRIPAEEIKTKAGLEMWKKKVKDWSYHEFIRNAFLLGVKNWKNGMVSSPYEYLSQVLPERPIAGTKAPNGMLDPNNFKKIDLNLCLKNYK
jgi:2-polyprenyl-6-methoxyphenol hydroxylase-like FAD-dependent oxidoreductase